MKNPRYLTKSRFKLGLECPTKLFYTAKRSEYSDIKLNDPFLDALANGGYQVGELAKHYYLGGYDITSLDYEKAEAQTQLLLQQDEVVIYEPAIRFGNLFIRIDILEKKGSHLNLIEVKSKSIDLTKENIFWSKNKKSIKSDWKPYLMDVAFQHHVLAHAMPDYSISNFLMLADKNAIAKTDGLNQKFPIVRDDNRKAVRVSDTLTAADLEHSILCLVNVNKEVSFIENSMLMSNRSFEDNIDYLAKSYEKDQRLFSPIGKHCKKCEFKTDSDSKKAGLKSGFKECWKEALGWQDNDFEMPNILEIWNCRSADKLIADDKIKLNDLTAEDIGVDGNVLSLNSSKDRQWLQVVMSRDGDTDAFFDQQGFKQVMVGWTYPLHFIDFETTAVALPFTKGRKPYETVAFQFSHHIYYEDGTIVHKDEYLNAVPGQYPNLDFVRKLKVALEGDSGTIFRYAPHENTVLNHIHQYIEGDREAIEDADDLLRFIESITHSIGSAKRAWCGDRDMVDMLDLVKKFYYHPMMKGSNSIKFVLPAVLQSSSFVQHKYARPIYGSKEGIPSANFTNFKWVQYNNSLIVDPYKLLPKLFEDASPENEKALISDDDTINNGGAALTAYGKLQFEVMSDYERERLKIALLKYCELDTMAMVMIYEAFHNWRST